MRNNESFKIDPHAVMNDGKGKNDQSRIKQEPNKSFFINPEQEKRSEDIGVEQPTFKAKRIKEKIKVSHKLLQRYPWGDDMPIYLTCFQF